MASGGNTKGTPPNPRDAGGGIDSGPPDSGGPIGSGESVPETIDMSGGSITLAGAELTIPPGALSAPTQITITETTDAAPAGYTRYSPVWRSTRQMGW
jgi:hypothetical protein